LKKNKIRTTPLILIAKKVLETNSRKNIISKKNILKSC